MGVSFWPILALRFVYCSGPSIREVRVHLSHGFIAGLQTFAIELPLLMISSVNKDSSFFMNCEVLERKNNHVETLTQEYVETPSHKLITSLTFGKSRKESRSESRTLGVSGFIDTGKF